MSDRHEHTDGQWAGAGGAGGGGGKRKGGGGGGSGGEVDYALAKWQTTTGGKGGTGGFNLPVLHDWLAGQGLDHTKLPGGEVPSWIRWCEAAPSGWVHREGKNQRTYRPGVIAMTYAQVSNGKGVRAPGEEDRRGGLGFKGLWVGLPAMKAGTDAEAKPVPDWSQPVTERREGSGKCEGFCQLVPRIPAGVLIVTEDLLSSLAALISTRGRVKGGPHDGSCVTAWAWLGDRGFGGVRLPDRGVGSPGQGAGKVRTVILAAALEKGTAAALNIAANAIAGHARAGARVDVIVRVPSAAVAPTLVVKGEGDQAEDLPAGEAKRVTWHDVYRAGGADAVARGLLDGIDLSDSDDREAEGGGGARRPGEMVEVGDGDMRRLMPTEDLRLARMFIEEHYAAPLPEDGDRSARAGTCHYLLQIVEADEGDRDKGKFARWNGKHWEDIPAAAIEAQIRQWLTPCAIARELKDGIDYVAFNPTRKKVTDVRTAVGQEMLVTGTAKLQDRRFWLRPTHDERGRPRWGMKAWERLAVHTSKSGGAEGDGSRPAPESLMCFPNAHVSTSALAAGRLEWWKPTELLYNTSIFPVDVPLVELGEAIVSDWGPILDRYCPTWRRFIEALPWGDDERTASQQIIGYCQRRDVSIKSANCVFLTGPGDSGKGTWVSGLVNAVGVEQKVQTSLQQMNDKFHLATFRDKLVAIIDEQEEAGFNEAAFAKQIIKLITGGGSTGLQGKWEQERQERLWTRFVFAVNEMPDIKDRSGTFLNRVLVLEFRKSHTGRADPTIKAGIEREQVGLILYGMAGQVSLGLHGGRIVQPKGGQSALALMRDYSSIYERFVEEWLVVGSDAGPLGPEHVVAVEDLQAAWCLHDSIEVKPNLRAAFAKALSAPLRKYGWVGEYLGDGKPRFTRLAFSSAASEHVAAVRDEANRRASDNQWKTGTLPAIGLPATAGSAPLYVRPAAPAPAPADLPPDTPPF